MADENGRWRRQDESFWRTHHEAWERTDGVGGDIVQQIITIVRQVSNEPSGQPDPLDDDLPGG